MRHPLILLTAAVCAVVVPLHGSPALPVAALGELTGLLAGLLALQLGLLAGALITGARVHQVVIGVGTRVVDWTTPRRVVVLRALPLLLSVSVGPGKSPARLRMWGAALSSAVLGVAATATAVVLACTARNGFGTAVAVGCAATVGYALVPRKTAGSTSTGWLLLHLLRLTGVRARQLDAAPLVTSTVDAIQDGDIEHAVDLAARIADEYPTLRTATAARVLVLQAQGRYAEALLLAMTLAGDHEQTPQEAAVAFAALAGLAYATVEAGQLEPELGLGTAAQALENAETLGYPTHKLNGSRALRELLLGNADKAVTLARLSADSSDDRLGRADDLATLARAHMAAGNNPAARAALREAEAIVPWWPRVAVTRSRLDLA
ncbi:hypothetical protein V5P93_001649 [Actinokineospora auranticolor]|uniref:hypothetical protein n=1 Tax=Actinokineospora auranticolor TaxID=155976 RepID=UPI000CEBEFA5|nr:hypothetical protein [Actinokineospora auranticolor]